MGGGAEERQRRTVTTNPHVNTKWIMLRPLIRLDSYCVFEGLSRQIRGLQAINLVLM